MANTNLAKAARRRLEAGLQSPPRMRRFVFVLSLLLSPLTAYAQWRPFFDGALFATHAAEYGPKPAESRTFSTNWLTAGTAHALGDGSVEARARVSLEPFTISREGYPQLLQYVPPLVDHMRAQDFVQELAIDARWRVAHVYLAPVGEPPLGAQNFEQRNSSVDFAEAPFGYDIQESFHVATRVIDAGLTSSAVAIDGAVFHASQTTGRHSSIEDGDIDSWSARIRIAPQSRFSAQLSTGRLGDANVKVDSASVSYGGPVASASAIWTKREAQQAYGLELALRPGRTTILGRAEWVDRPAGIFTAGDRRMAHVTLGMIIDVFYKGDYRVGAGINTDYHSSSTKTLLRNYGHKPQGVYAFIRVRTNRRVSL